MNYENFATARWDKHFLDLALCNAAMSKDPNTRVGAVIVGPDHEVRAMGFNGLPRGIADTYERLNDRELKLQLIVHAEMNALLNAVRVGISVRGCTMYLAAVDASGLVWGGAPCVRCAVEIIQSGISGIVAPPFKSSPSHWTESVIQAKELLHEAGVTIREVEI